MGSETDTNPISTIYVGIGGVKSGRLPPKPLDELGLDEGDEIEWRIEDGELVGSPVDDDGIDSVDEAMNAIRGVFHGGEVCLNDDEIELLDGVLGYLRSHEDILNRLDSLDETASSSVVHDLGATMTHRHPRSDVISPFNIDADDMDLSAGRSGEGGRSGITDADECPECGFEITHRWPSGRFGLSRVWPCGCYVSVAAVREVPKRDGYR